LSQHRAFETKNVPQTSHPKTDIFGIYHKTAATIRYLAYQSKKCNPDQLTPGEGLFFSNVQKD